MAFPEKREKTVRRVKNFPDGQTRRRQPGGCKIMKKFKEWRGTALMKKLKRFFASILCICMIITSCPDLLAWAAGDTAVVKPNVIYLKRGLQKLSINIMSSDILKISLEFHGDLFFQYMSLSQFLCLFFGMKNRKSYFRVTLIKVSKNTLFASYFSEIGLYYLRAVTL